MIIETDVENADEIIKTAPFAEHYSLHEGINDTRQPVVVQKYGSQNHAGSVRSRENSSYSVDATNVKKQFL
jgi:hypothetical protein